MAIDKTQGIYIKIVVKPRAKKTKVPTHIEGNTIFVSIKSPPVRGKANKELLRELSNLFNIQQSRITIVSGHKSTKKTIFLEMNPEIVKQILSQFKSNSF
jgi:uncharacterized protein (TIGR00251 family)